MAQGLGSGNNKTEAEMSFLMPDPPWKADLDWHDAKNGIGPQIYNCHSKTGKRSQPEG
jgi:hypothetical protein